MQISIHEVNFYQNNAKIHDKTQIDRIARSIEEFGFLQPIVIDTSFNLIVGHGRLQAALQLGWVDVRIGETCAKRGEQFVPAILVDSLTPEQVNAYRLLDNRLNESSWDMDKVKSEIEEQLGESQGMVQEMFADLLEGQKTPFGEGGDGEGGSGSSEGLKKLVLQFRASDLERLESVLENVKVTRDVKTDEAAILILADIYE